MSLSDVLLGAAFVTLDVFLYSIGVRPRWIGYITACLALAALAASDWGHQHPDISGLTLSFATAVALADIYLTGRQTRLRRAQAVSEAATAERLAFESFPAELGIVDHGVNLEGSMQEMMTLLHRVAPAVAAICMCLFKETPARLPARKDPAHVLKKRQVLKDAAEQMRPHVVELEKVVAPIKEHADTFKAAYRAMFALPIQTDGDRQSLRDLKGVYGGGVATAFRQCSELTRARRADIGRFAGNQQDLNRIVTRTTAAMDQIAVVAADVSEFCSVEMPATIDRLLSGSKHVP